MKPKYIFSAVFAVSIFLSILLPSIGLRRVKAVDAAGVPAATAPAAAFVQAAQMAAPAPALAAPAPTLAPIQAGAASAPAPTLPPVVLDQAAGQSQAAPANPQAAPANPQAAPANPQAAPADPQPAQAPAAKIPQTSLPGLKAFAAGFGSIPANQVAGAYVDRLFGLPVVQQPPDNPDFVSQDDNTLTQFAKPQRFNVIGLLAHNFLSGKPFDQLRQGQEVFVVYGGGRTAAYRVTGFLHYQAVNSADINTDYIDLDDPSRPVLTQQQVFDRAYTNTGQLVLQTCIEQNGDYSWGRLFVLAEPE